MVYLLHFDRPYCHARHYVGFVDGGPAALAKRLDKHRRGDGARLLEVITEAGIGFTLARTWPDGDRTFERRLKNRHNAPRLCPCCRAACRHTQSRQLTGANA